MADGEECFASDRQRLQAMWSEGWVFGRGDFRGNFRGGFWRIDERKTPSREWSRVKLV